MGTSAMTATSWAEVIGEASALLREMAMLKGLPEGYAEKSGDLGIVLSDIYEAMAAD